MKIILCTKNLFRIHLLLLLIFLFFFSFNSKAEDNFIMFGAISNTCSEMDNILSLNIEEDNITLRDYMTATFQGFLSGINFFINEINGSYKRLNEFSTDYLFEFVEVYCKNNPDETFAEALTEYIIMLPDIIE